MFILNINNLRENLTELKFTAPSIEEMIKVANKINESAELKEFFKSYYENTILTDKWKEFWNIEEPDEIVKSAFDKQFSLFYLLCFLERLPYTKEKYKELNIPYEIYLDTLSDIGVWLQNWYNMYGYYCFNNFGWIWRHLTADLFRLGRLQYQAVKSPNNLHAFKNRESGLVVILAEKDMEINKDGNATWSGGVKDDVTDFKTEFFEDENCYIGNIITPIGKAKKDKVKLLKSEWERYFDNEDYIMELHIPRGDSLLPEDCKKSYEMATNFYKKYFSGINVKGMKCHTWLFTPQLQDILPQTSNIVKFQREFYLYPYAGDYKFLWNFVFNELTKIEDAPQDTYLRRKVVEYVKEEKLLFDLSGYCLHGFEDWGKQVHFNGMNNELLNNIKLEEVF